MAKKIQTFVYLSLFSLGIVWADEEPRLSTQFATANIRFEQNVTDQDVEVVIEVKGGIEGLTKFSIVSPDGRNIVNVNTPDNLLGLRHFNFESPEPKDVNSLKRAYPEGDYQFSGVSSSGTKLSGKASLSHALANPTSILSPKDEATDVAIRNLEIAWTPVKNAVAYLISIEQLNSDLNFTAKLPGSAAIFLMPNGFLLPGKEYTLSIGVVSEKGNITYVETSFTTKSGVR